MAYTRENNVVTFTYSDFLDRIYETSQHMVKNMSTEGGEYLLEDYAMEDGNPTDEQRERMISVALWGVMENLKRLCNKDTEVHAGDSISIKVIDNERHRESDLGFIDNSILDMIVYGTLAQWFVSVGLTDLNSACDKEYLKAKSVLIPAVNDLYMNIVDSKLSNPFGKFIKEPETEEEEA